MTRYNPKDIETKWQERWARDNLYCAVDFDEKRPKFVMLTEFPYPSGEGLHIGHVREYTLADIIARRKRMGGYNVLYPMGYDAFGLPTENYAIKNKISPQIATERNISIFRKQFDDLGLSIDWNREVNTTDPGYYKWTQWLFLQFFKKGLAYQDEIAINWCPKCKTGLANEEVINGRHERCDTPVEKKFLRQWLLRITDYADKLIEGLNTVDYPSRIADQQINWIGKSKGAEVDFAVEGHKEKLRIFTTRPDTLFGATFLVLAPEHPLVDVITTESQIKNVKDYKKTTQSKSEIERQDTDREKTGVFTGAYAINPVNHEKVPVWIADYVLMGYGTGAIMAVPAHDERDYAFALKFGLQVRRVIKNKTANDKCTTSEGIMVDSGKYDGMNSAVMREKIVADLVEDGVATEKVNYKLRDWIFSRQHYWGEPIPIIHCENDGAVPVPDEQLPVELPIVEHYEPTDTGESPLAIIKEWVNVKCPKCGSPAKRETDTMPNWAGSSWYYLRYFDAHNDQAFASQEKLKYWGEVDIYLGGMEHTTLHLLYSRFWHQFFYDQGFVPNPEPYASRRGQGIILAGDGSKMSKSKGNVVNPNDVIEKGYGADSLRMALVFLAPYDQTTLWNNESVAGTFRFLQRVWTLVHEWKDHNDHSKKNESNSGEIELVKITHKAIKHVSADIESMSYNTAIASLMEYVNELYKFKADSGFESKDWILAIESLLKMLAPFAPHITEELWELMGNSESVHVSQWPVHDEKYLLSETMKIVVQINGKVRSTVELHVDSTEEQVIEAAKADSKIASNLAGKEIVREIYVPGRLVNFVI